MNTHPNKFETYSFLWSEARLVIAAVALFIGGVPPAVKYGLLASGSTVLTMSWIVSGLASVYLLYEYYVHKKVFPTKKSHDSVTFFISVISGINLGLTGVLGRNFGMSITSNRVVFIVVGLLYLYSAYYLYKRWQESGKRIF